MKSLLLLLSVLVLQVGCAQIEKTANYNEQNLSKDERQFANKYWTSLTGLTWNRWSNMEKRSDRDFYLEQRLKPDSEAYKELVAHEKPQAAAPPAQPATSTSK